MEGALRKANNCLSVLYRHNLLHRILKERILRPCPRCDTPFYLLFHGGTRKPYAFLCPNCAFCQPIPGWRDIVKLEMKQQRAPQGDPRIQATLAKVMKGVNSNGYSRSRRRRYPQRKRR